jgi:hypothetical protein
MPPTRTAGRSKKPPPDGFEDIEDTLLEFQNKMKDAENASHDGKKKHEMLWPIFQITHQRSKYIYDMYYEKEAISKTLYDWLLKNGYADAMLIAKWKKQGYEKVRAKTRRVFGPGVYANGRIALLRPLYPDQRNELPIDLHLPRAEETAQREPGHPVCKLWVQRLFIGRLKGPRTRTTQLSAISH